LQDDWLPPGSPLMLNIACLLVLVWFPGDLSQVV
jgi:hypothetical protein